MSAEGEHHQQSIAYRLGDNVFQPAEVTSRKSANRVMISPKAPTADAVHIQVRPDPLAH